MSSVPAPNNYCLFRLVVPPDLNFSLDLVSNLSTTPGTLVSFLPGKPDLQIVGDFLVAALNNKNPIPVSLTQDVNGKRTLSMTASGSSVTITIFEANVSTTLSVTFSTVAHFFILATAASGALAWAGSAAPKLAAPGT
jgi:hypothetical protein